jgi:Ca2+-binding RTX toxin-like protein
MKYPGTWGDDDFTGTSGNDIFSMGKGGSDTVNGGGGNDLFKFGAAFDVSDKIDGGAGLDTLFLNGDYSAELSIYSTALVNVERIVLGGGYLYGLSFHDGVIASGQSLTVDATGSGGGSIDAGGMSGASIDTTFILKTGPATMFFDGGPGTNILRGGTGQDIVTFGADFDSNDRLNGGTGGGNYLHLGGDYSAGLNITGAMLHNFQYLTTYGAFDFKLTTADAVVAAGDTLSVDGTSIGAGHYLNFNGSHETDGRFVITGSSGNDILTGGAQNDTVFGSLGGNDRISTGDGNDTIQMTDSLTAADRIDGGAGSDELDLGGDYSGGVIFAAATMVNVESIYLNPGSSYKLVMSDGNVAAGQNLQIVGGNVDSAHTIHVNASKETNGTYYLGGGSGNDVLIGGQGGNTFVGGLGQDHLTAGAGADVFTYNNGDPAASTSVGRDIITGFDALHDTFDMFTSVSGIDAAVATGNLSRAQFDAQLAHSVGANQLHAGDAVLFTPDGGNLAGHTFLVVDANGVAGYQAGQDYVFQLESATHLASLSASNFI